MRSGHAASRAGRDEGAVATLFPRVEPFELLESRFAPRVAAIVDMPSRHRELAREARARIERTVGADRVRVGLVDVAHALGHAIAGRKSVTLRLFAYEGHLVFQRVAGITRRAGARADRRHARALQ